MITQDEANRRYTAYNEAGMGFYPFPMEVPDGTVAGVVAQFIAEGWEMLHEGSIENTTVLSHENGTLLAIKGNANGQAARAIYVTDAHDAPMPSMRRSP